jgi:hypothetical protein
VDHDPIGVPIDEQTWRAVGRAVDDPIGVRISDMTRLED